MRLQNSHAHVGSTLNVFQYCHIDVGSSLDSSLVSFNAKPKLDACCFGLNIFYLINHFDRTEQNRTLLKTMHLRPLTGGVRDKHKHVMK